MELLLIGKIKDFSYINIGCVNEEVKRIYIFFSWKPALGSILSGDRVMWDSGKSVPFSILDALRQCSYNE